jgi:hypothetical protein
MWLDDWPHGWVEIPVTEWIEDSEVKHRTSLGDLTNLEWLREEKRRINKHTPFSRPFIRIHPQYFDKDSHSRRVYKKIALYRFISRAELAGQEMNAVASGTVSSLKNIFSPPGSRLRPAACASP